jgi:phage/plasmid-associated DNA primase
MFRKNKDVADPFWKSACRWFDSAPGHHFSPSSELRGARLVTVQETEEDRQWTEAKIKALTGVGQISARFIRQDSFAFTR